MPSQAIGQTALPSNPNRTAPTQDQRSCHGLTILTFTAPIAGPWRGAA